MLIELTDAFMESSRMSTNCSVLKYVYDVRKWLSPYIDEIHHHTIPHVFLFKKGESGHCEMFSKHWAKDDWLQSSQGDILLKVSTNSIASTRKGVAMRDYSIATKPHLCKVDFDF